MATIRYEWLTKEFKSLCCSNWGFNFMEIGTWTGARAARMLAQGSGPICYYGFDLFEDLTPEVKKREFCGKAFPPSVAEVRKKLENTGKDIHLWKGDSTVLIPKLCASGTLPKMDLIFIDGGHSVETILSDWENVQALIRPTTVVVFDDYFLEMDDFGCKRVVNDIDLILYDVEVMKDAFDKDRKSKLTIHLVKVTVNGERPSS